MINLFSIVMSSMSKVLEELYMHGILVAFIQANVFFVYTSEWLYYMFRKSIWRELDDFSKSNGEPFILQQSMEFLSL